VLILKSENSDSVIIVKQEDCHAVSVDDLSRYLSSHIDESHYYITDINMMTSSEILLGKKKSTSSISRKKDSKDINEVYYRTAQNQIIAVDDMEGLMFNSSNDMKSHSGLIAKYKTLSDKFIKMIELGYIEKIGYEEFMRVSSDIANNKKTDEDIIIRGSVSNFMDDLQDSGAPDDGPARIDL